MAQIDRDAKNALAKKLEESDKESLSLEVDLKKTKNEVELVKQVAVREMQYEFAGKNNRPPSWPPLGVSLSGESPPFPRGAFGRLH